MRKQFYLDLVAKLKEEVEAIQHYDLWNRQVEFMAKNNPFKFPAVFIEFLPIEYRQLGLGVQEADVSFRIHVVSQSLASSVDGSPYQDEALVHLDLLDDIHYALSAWNTSYSGPMVRISSTPNHDHEQVILETETYKACMTDTSGVKRVREVSVTPVFTAELHKRPS